MSTPIKILLFAVAVLFAGFAIAYQFDIFNIADALQSKGTSKVTAITGDIDESDCTKYEGEPIDGSEVINCIKHFQKDTISINVNNGKSTTTYILQSDLVTKASGTLSEAKDITKLNVYINPNVKFTGVVDRDPDTDAIIGLTFTKK